MKIEDLPNASTGIRTSSIEGETVSRAQLKAYTRKRMQNLVHHPA